MGSLPGVCYKQSPGWVWWGVVGLVVLGVWGLCLWFSKAAVWSKRLNWGKLGVGDSERHRQGQGRQGSKIKPQREEEKRDWTQLT